MCIRDRFSDSSDYYVPYVAALGIVTGYPDGTFHPKDSIKRQDAAIMLQRLAVISTLFASRRCV